MLPARIHKNSKRADERRRSPACGSHSAIECAHVRSGTDGGTGLKPSDIWCISLCKDCHARQHQIGEPAFERAHNIDMKKLAREFLKASPHRQKLEAKDG